MFSRLVINENTGGRTLSYEIRPLERSFGLETELAVRFNRDSPHESTQSCLDIYHAICRDLRQHSAAAPAPGGPAKQGLYFANGSAIWFETQTLGTDGLIEVCTPECKDPMELAANHAAMEKVLAGAAAKLSGDVGLLKNCLDPRGIVYGAQENYEVIGFDDEEASKWRDGIERLKWIDRTLLLGIAICPLVVLALLYLLPTTALLASLGAMVVSYFGLCWIRGRWLSPSLVLQSFICFFLSPKSFYLSRFYHRMKIGRTYEKVKPFIVSRVIWSGAGGVDHKGRLFLGQKAKSRNIDWLVLLADIQKPIFCFNYLFKECFRQQTTVEIYPIADRLMSKRQRLCLSVGDSNMSQEVNWLKVATTSLVLDAIEAGAIREIPTLDNAITALRTINNDPSLESAVSTSRGQMTAIEIQQFYLNACRQYVESFEDPLPQALEVLKCWNDYLIRLKTDQESLVGRVDWITKREIMRAVVKKCGYLTADQAMGTADEFKGFKNLPALQKADLKFHELGAAGYNQQLVDGGATDSMLNHEELDRASRMPPSVATAAQRCRYIREFGSQIEWITWDEVKLWNEAPKNFRVQQTAETN